MFANAASPKPSNRSRTAVAIAILASLLIAGCASRQSVQLPDLDSWDVRNRVLAERHNWEFAARIAVSAGDDGFNGKLRWVQESESFRATVSGPLGIGTVRIAGDSDSVVLTDKDGVHTELSDAETELQYRYGWTIPVASLRYWALGIPDPSAEAQTEFDDGGQLAMLVQRDWRVTISRYRDGGGQPMPNRLSATNADTRVRLVIDRWMFFD